MFNNLSSKAQLATKQGKRWSETALLFLLVVVGGAASLILTGQVKVDSRSQFFIGCLIGGFTLVMLWTVAYRSTEVKKGKK